MEIEEYKKQKLGELKRHFASEEQALEKKGYQPNNSRNKRKWEENWKKMKVQNQ